MCVHTFFMMRKNIQRQVSVAQLNSFLPFNDSDPSSHIKHVYNLKISKNIYVCYSKQNDKNHMKMTQKIFTKNLSITSFYT